MEISLQEKGHPDRVQSRRRGVHMAAALYAGLLAVWRDRPLSM